MRACARAMSYEGVLFVVVVLFCFLLFFSLVYQLNF